MCPDSKSDDDGTEEPGISGRFVPKGIAHLALQNDAKPVSVTFVLVRDFTMLAFAAAIEPLRLANQLSGQELFRWNVFSEGGGLLPCSNGIPLQPDGPLPPLASPGYVLVCSGLAPESRISASLADWLRAQWRRGRTVGGICTGAYALARAGILKGRAFTLHWENIEAFQERFPDLYPQRQVYCVDDRIITCAGGAAASDLALHLIHSHFGAAISQAVMNMCLLSARRSPTDNQTPSISSRIGTRNRHLLNAIAFFEENVEDPVSIQDCAESIGVSTRQIERLFQANLGVTPGRYLTDLRLQRSRSLLSSTDMSVVEVAVACCFASSSHFSRCFRRRFGVSPHKFAHFNGN